MLLLLATWSLSGEQKNLTAVGHVELILSCRYILCQSSCSLLLGENQCYWCITRYFPQVEGNGSHMVLNAVDSLDYICV